MKKINVREIKRKRWLLSENLQILRIEEAQCFVQRMGIVSIFSDKILPSLASAIYTNELPTQFEADQRVWDFAHALMSEKKSYYGRLLKSRNVLISIKLLPYFLRLWPIPDYKRLYRSGRLSTTAASIMELLLDSKPLMTIQIKDRLKYLKKSSKKIFERALKELQENFLICCAGKIAHCKCRWRFSLWSSTQDWIPQGVQSRAHALSQAEAMDTLIEKFVYTTIKTDEKAIVRFFKWPLDEVRTRIELLIEKGRILRYHYGRETFLFKDDM
ncbi:MAG: hypothetical protein JSV97_04775 [candidate division WOR-3 bacterium]|nr:MAG: hypothetical protein JSV97_04775 [candidate division WOR-3 bacterium]